MSGASGAALVFTLWIILWYMSTAGYKDKFLVRIYTSTQLSHLD